THRLPVARRGAGARPGSAAPSRHARRGGSRQRNAGARPTRSRDAGAWARPGRRRRPGTRRSSRSTDPLAVLVAAAVLGELRAAGEPALAAEALEWQDVIGSDQRGRRDLRRRLRSGAPMRAPLVDAQRVETAE